LIFRLTTFKEDDLLDKEEVGDPPAIEAKGWTNDDGVGKKQKLHSLKLVETITSITTNEEDAR